MPQPNHNRSVRLLTSHPILDVLLGLLLGVVGSYAIYFLVTAVGYWIQPSSEYLTRSNIDLTISAICSVVACYYTGRRWLAIGCAAVISALVVLSLLFFVSHIVYHDLDYTQTDSVEIAF